MTDTMLERMARAIWAETAHGWDFHGNGVGSFEGPENEHSVTDAWNAARAALEAIRPRDFGDLPEEVCQAAEGAGAMSYKQAHEILAAMVDAILSEGK